MRTRLLALVTLSVSALACSSQQSATGRAATAVVPDFAACGEGDCSWMSQPGACQVFADWRGIPGVFGEAALRPDVIHPGVNVVNEGGNVFTANVTGAAAFDWTASIPLRFVVASTGFDAHVYVYPNKATADTGLVAPASPLTQVLFCYPLEVTATATASAAYTRTWSWSIEKSSPTAAVTLATGATVDVAYAVTVTGTPVDSGWTVSGTIAVQNPTPAAVATVAVEATFAGAPVTVSCGGLQGPLAPGTVLTCTWSAAPGAAVDGELVATVTTPGAVAVASAVASFGGTAPALVDDCAAVTDDHVGPLGTVCAVASSEVAPTASYGYTVPVGPYATCDASGAGRTFTNTASFTAASGASGSSSWAVQVAVPCPPPPNPETGCTLTQGYWKTHSRHGPARYDVRWQNVGPLEEDTVFFLSGKTWLEVFETPVDGNLYWALAHQYMAAKLNVLAGASPDALGTALADIEYFFSIKTPTMALSVTRTQIVQALITLLDDFNSGKTGPGHCEGAGDDGGTDPGTDPETDPSTGDDDCGDHDGHHGDGEHGCGDHDGHHGHGEHGCGEHPKHDECRDHDRKDREHGGCGDHAKHERCREHDGHHDRCERHEGKDRCGGEHGKKDRCEHGEHGKKDRCEHGKDPGCSDHGKKDRCERKDGKGSCGGHEKHDDEKHQECREHDRDDRKYGCGDRKKHGECREHDRKDAKS